MIYHHYANALVLKKGTESEKERLDAGLLSDRDLDQAVRNILFAPVSAWPKWRKISVKEVIKIARLYGKSDGQDEVTFETIPADALSEDEWQKFKQLKRLMPEADDISPYWVVATCGLHYQKFPKARITITFRGRKFQQELAL